MDQLTSSQLSEWEAMDVLEPIGEWKADFRMACVMALIANVNRDSKKKPEPFSFNDFMPQWGKEDDEPKRQTVEEQKRMLMDIVSAFGGKRK